MHGKGEYSWDDGRHYSGDYVNDKKEGYGFFVWPDKRTFRGFWKNGKQDGIGIYDNGKG